MNEIAKNILVADDEPKIRRLLRNCFEPEGFNVFEAENGREINACLAEKQVDLITLDLNLGVENGLTIAAELRVNHNIPIIIVTGKGDMIDKVIGLEMGADDYISKPFHVREVIARVRAVLRRTESQRSVASVESVKKKFSFEGWKADFGSYELHDPSGETCDLTSADFKLLEFFLENPQKVLSRDLIMDWISGNEWTPYDRTVDNQVARLRKKLEPDLSKPKFLKTIRGIGYIFSVDVIVS